ncbi:GGDEF domain-containing protein [Photobacterium sanguinicancri]|uniref:GGDEF domain-containing protein n=1 Tax=Photobacterium sanguinicancri TaxID=875932 RepID=UPI0026E1FF65|nr:GGDEF domain-containing protein [Photobacterium sanguinicancri]MDO6497850.1 diguanylate cyclase [Photobacterium sanguinicancri]
MTPPKISVHMACFLLLAGFSPIAHAATSLLDQPLFLFALILAMVVFAGSILALVFHNAEAVTFRKLYSMLTHLPIATLIVSSKDGKLMYGNKASRALLGIRKVGNNYFYPPEIEAQMMCDILRPHMALSTFNNWEEELELFGKAPRSVLVAGQYTRYKWQPAWLLFVSPSNTATSPETTSLREHRVLQGVLNSLSELVYFQDKSGKVMGTNKAFDRFWRGRESEGLIDSIEVSLKNNSAHTWTTSPDGASRLLETNKTALVGGFGEILGSLSISHDVTDWHEMQESLKQEIEKREITEQALAHRNNLLDTILNASQDPIGLYNEHWVYVGCNEPFARALGQTQESLLGKNASEVMDPDKWREFRVVNEQVIREGITVKTEDYVMLPDGEPIWYEVATSPYRDPIEGTAGVLVMGRDVTERKHAQQQLADAIMELQELSFIDCLTKVPNRRSFDEHLRKMWHSHIREQKPLTLILCDIDNFKAYNDNYGHQQGDRALLDVAKTLSKVIKRETDEVARYGGEEFAFLLPCTDLNGGQMVARNIHRKIAQAAIEHAYSEVTDVLTVSLGVATVTPVPNQDYGELVRMADIALYKAKASGRNCTMVMSDNNDF